MTPGIYLVHKPAGQTSFSLVQAFMEEVRASGLRRDKLPACHGGALDPFADGLLLILAGQATRLMDLLHPIPKTYVAEIAWGSETDSGDSLGQMTKSTKSLTVTERDLTAALEQFVGWREQVPPSTSNKRVDGERAYRKAHRGETVVLPPSRVYLHSARWRSHDLPRGSVLEIVTGGGYYVRSLARDLGRATGAFGHLTKLHRTAIGPWSDPRDGRELIRGAQLYPWCPSVEIDERELALLRGGRGIERRPPTAPEWKLPDGFPDPHAPLRALIAGRIVALLRERDGKLHAAPVLRGPL
ncbi:MAG: tRNA pseudouridine(55) synthase [Myxococcales bacterium]|nr:tRNA pseudouridine(55) synthase [Myxococcales bacterium]